MADLEIHYDILRGVDFVLTKGKNSYYPIKYVDELEIEIKALKSKLEATEAPIRKYAAYEEALTASPDTKDCYSGEFFLKYEVECPDEPGASSHESRPIPWTLIKDIMKKIKERAQFLTT